MLPSDELLREIAARAWQQALQEKSREFVEDVARRIGAAMPANGTPQPVRSQELRDGTLLISNAKSQSEALESLLAACSSVTPACGLLVMRGQQAAGWASAGLASAENFKRASLDCTRGAAAAVLCSSAGRRVRAADLLDPAFTSLAGLDPTQDLLILPLLVKERVAALLLAVSATANDEAELELLLQVAQLSLELQAYRKGAPAPAEAQRPAIETPAAASAVPAGTGLQHSTAARLPQTYSAPAPTTAPDELHERGRRFAKLLVEEIKLYNHAKVAEGRAKGDLYSRLREEIDKSRAAYQKRFGESVKDVDYFTQELMRILADNDPRVMGAGFPG